MENLNKAVNLLQSILRTMDVIQITGLENQDRFVGCANAVKSVEKTLTDFLCENEKSKEHALEGQTDG